MARQPEEDQHSMPQPASPVTNEQKRVLVTAGAGGIGRVIAEALLAENYRVHVCDIDSAAIDSFLHANPEAGATLADVADPAQVDRVFAELADAHDHLDILVNNAGIAGPTAHVEDIEPVDWDKTISVNLNGHFYCTRQAVPMLKAANGGSIITIASNAAFFGCSLRAPYVASKWALVGLTKTLAMELGPFGIRVNAICPSSVEGDRIDAVIERDAVRRGKSTEDVREMYMRQSSMRSFVSAEDVANLALFLASDKSAKISGQALGLDGHTESLTNWLD
jgi:NAD(P)-dependent dehydrogenase (short-subunit alcohol dehydrogenase family)